MYQHQITAESIAFALDKPRRVRADEYRACCPAHDDKSPSLSITQKSDAVLVYCWSGCSQAEVIDALRGQGLWPKERERAWNPRRPQFTRDELEYFHLYCLVYRDNVKAGYSPTTHEDRKFRAFSWITHRHGVVNGL